MDIFFYHLYKIFTGIKLAHLIVIANFVPLNVFKRPQGPVPTDGLEQRVESPSDTMTYWLL